VLAFAQVVPVVRRWLSALLVFSCVVVLG